VAEVGSGKLVIVGFMAAGKSTFAKHAAERLGWSLSDADAALEERLGEPIGAFFDREGEAAFRVREQEVVLDLLGAPERAVIALGGGAVESEGVRSALADHIVVHVDVDLATAWERATRNSDRPLARDRERFAALHERRRPIYDSLARVIMTGGKNAEAASEAALRCLKRQTCLSQRSMRCRSSMFIIAGMIKADIVNKVAEVSEISRVKAAQAVDTVIEGLRNALARGQRIELRGFGVFQVKQRKKGIGRNPKTGVEVKIPPGNTIRFKPGKELRDLTDGTVAAAAAAAAAPTAPEAQNTTPEE